jgi:hypothetical protein
MECVCTSASPEKLVLEDRGPREMRDVHRRAKIIDFPKFAGSPSDVVTFSTSSVDLQVFR